MSDLEVGTHPLEPLDRGLEFGDGLFETMTVVERRVRLFDRHWARLARGAERLGLVPPPRQAIERSLLNAIERTDAVSVVKLVVTRGRGGRGYGADPGAPVSVFVHAGPARRPPWVLDAPGLRLGLLTVRLAQQPLLAGIKHLNRLEQVLGRREVDVRGLDDGIMLDTSGRVVCTTHANVYAVIDGVIVTPELTRAGVEGVMRAALLESWAAMGQRVEIRDVYPTDLAQASQLFVSNAVMGVVAVDTFEGRAYSDRSVVAAAHREIGRW